jgi:hypothetical protein
MRSGSHFLRAGTVAFGVLAVATSCRDDTPNVSIEITPLTATIASGDTVRFRAAVRDRGGAEVSGAEVHWTTSDTALAMDGAGLATGRFTDAEKTVVVTATSGNASKSVTVVLKGCVQCGSWTVFPGVSPWRQRSVVALIDGIVYVAGGGARGGVGGTSQSGLQVFDPTAGRWSRRASMPDPRQYAQGVALGGRLYMFGGEILVPSGATAVARSYDPSSNTWTELPPMPRVRIGGGSWAAAVAVGGRVYVIGANSLAVDIYDPATNSWTLGATMSVVPGGMGPIVIDDKVYLFEGNVGVMYDPATDTWTSRAPMPSGRSAAIGAVLKGTLYAMGGTAKVGCCQQPSYLVEVFDPTTNSWASRSPAPITGHQIVFGDTIWHQIVFADTIGGKILVGMEGESAVQLYDAELNTWAVRASMPSVDANFLSSNARAVSVDGSVFVIALYTKIVQITVTDTSAVLRFTP